MKFKATLVRVQILEVDVEGSTDKEAATQAVEAAKVINDTSWKTVGTEVRKMKPL